MLVKGEIQTIDYTGNTCTVRMPVFESAGGGQEATTQAIFSNPPGVYNGYKVGDIVLVGFENNLISLPVILGKLYLGSEAENKDSRGTINCTDFKNSNSTSIPLSATIISTNDNSVKVEDDFSEFKTVGDIVSKVRKNSNDISSIKEKNGEVEYSTIEQAIGTWVDGKTIYRKVIIKEHTPVIAAGSNFSEAISLADISFNTIWTNLNMTLQIGDRYSLNQYMTQNTNDFWNSYIDTKAKTITIRGKAPDNISKHIIVIEYTKA